MLGKEDKFVFTSQGIFTKYFSQMTNDVFIKASHIWDATPKAKAIETAYQLKKQTNKTHIKVLEATQKPPT